MGWSKSDAIVLPLTLLAIVGATIFLWFLLYQKEDKLKKIPLIIITLTMLILEVIKQIKAIVEGYDFWTIPLHFCSLFLYFFPIAVFAKGKFQEFGKAMSLVCSAWLFCLFYFNPDSIISTRTTDNVFSSFSTFHTFFYHHLAIAFLFISVALGFYKINYKSLIYVLIGFTLYMAVVVPVTHLTQTNFCNMLFSNIPFMENLRQSVGQIIYTIVMYLIGVAGGCAMCLIYIGCIKLLFKLKNKDNKADLKS